MLRNGGVRSRGRGGARSSSDRLSRELSVTQCANLTDAAWHALEIGVPLNRFITINWSTARVEAPRAATAGFLKRAGDWLADRGLPRAYVWVRENDGGDHVHILIHVPSRFARDFSRRQRGWLLTLGAERRSGVIKTDAVARDYAAADASPAYYRQNLDVVIRYLLKGASERAAGFTDHRRRGTGLIQGQRAGVSHDLGKRAREIYAHGRLAFVANCASRFLADQSRARPRARSRTHA